MIKRGSKVYVWSHSEKEMMEGSTGEMVIGEVETVDVDFVNIRSILDNGLYRFHISNVCEVGTGPSSKDDNIVWEDYYV